MFALPKECERKESKCVLAHCVLNSVPYSLYDDWRTVKKGSVVVGDVNICQKILGYVKPNYFPDFVADFVFRKVYKFVKREPLPIQKADIFVKPLNWYKRFNGFVLKAGQPCPEIGPFFLSEVVEFSNEWRYYIADGIVVAAHWYKGVDEDLPPPELPFDIPEGTFCAMDMGVLADGRLAVVECHHPFACGWYGSMTTKDCSVYAKWLEGDYSPE